MGSNGLPWHAACQAGSATEGCRLLPRGCRPREGGKGQRGGQACTLTSCARRRRAAHAAAAAATGGWLVRRRRATGLRTGSGARWRAQSAERRPTRAAPSQASPAGRSAKAAALLGCLHQRDGVALQKDAAQRLARLPLDCRRGNNGYDGLSTKYGSWEERHQRLARSMAAVAATAAACRPHLQKPACPLLSLML